MLEIMTALMDFIRNIDMLIYVYHDGRLSIDFENQLPTILLSSLLGFALAYRPRGAKRCFHFFLKEIYFCLGKDVSVVLVKWQWRHLPRGGHQPDGYIWIEYRVPIGMCSSLKILFNPRL